MQGSCVCEAWVAMLSALREAVCDIASRKVY
jgi:hypothetical protein